jgi:glycosyltransferase involved in cell wall biosynthesis
VDNDYFQSQKKSLNKENTRSELGIPKDDLVLIMVGKIINLKRPYDLVDAVKKVKNQNLTIIFLGDGPEKEKLEDYVKKYNLKAIFPGFKTQNEISKYFVASDVYFMLSNKDNSPKAMNEAMNFGLPVICTNIVGTAHDLVDDGKNGFIVSVGDVESISKKIEFFNSNRDKLKHFSKNTFEKVNRFTFARDALAIYESVKE